MYTSLVKRLSHRVISSSVWARRYATSPSTKVEPLGKSLTVENNLKSETNRLAKTLKKFWNTVSVNTTADGNGGYTVELDGKPIRTALGHKLILPADRQHLAHLIAHEWGCISSLQIKPQSLPLTSLVSRAIDLDAAAASKDLEQIAKVGKTEDIAEGLLRYLDTDTLLVFSPKDEYEGNLRLDQEKRYRPIIKDVEQFLSKYSDKPVELTYLDSDRDGLRGNFQPKETREAAKKFLRTLSTWDLVAFEKVVLSAKSFICALLVLRAKSPVGEGDNSELHLSLEEIAQAATLEIIHQTDRWGEVEDTHDVDYQDIRRNINSAAIMAFQERS